MRFDAVSACQNHYENVKTIQVIQTNMLKPTEKQNKTESLLESLLINVYKNTCGLIRIWLDYCISPQSIKNNRINCQIKLRYFNRSTTKTIKFNEIWIKIEKIEVFNDKKKKTKKIVQLMAEEANDRWIEDGSEW